MFSDLGNSRMQNEEDARRLAVDLNFLEQVGSEMQKTVQMLKAWLRQPVCGKQA